MICFLPFSPLFFFFFFFDISRIIHIFLYNTKCFLWQRVDSRINRFYKCMQAASNFDALHNDEMNHY